MDDHKKKTARYFGHGGPKCHCCNDHFGKDRQRVNRMARHRLKDELAVEASMVFDEETEMIEDLLLDYYSEQEPTQHTYFNGIREEDFRKEYLPNRPSPSILTCDYCGEKSEEESDHDGWYQVHEMGVSLPGGRLACPKCVEKRKTKQDEDPASRMATVV